MKAIAGYTDPFLSPLSGIHLTGDMLPLFEEYIFVGNRENTAQASPALIDIRLDLIDLRHALSAQTAPIDATYILQKPNKILSNAQALNQLEDGILKNVQSILEMAVAGEDYLSATLASGKLLIGDQDDKATPQDKIALTNMADLSQSKIWVGDENNRPIESDFTPTANDATYILQTEGAALKNAQVLNDLGTGMAKIVTGGAFAIAIPDEDYATKETLEKIKAETEEFKNQAQQSAEQASASAEKAAASAEEATASATEASGAAAEATGAAGEASLAAGEASLSAIGAGASALAAGISAGSASSSASDAKSSASDALDSAKSAGKSAQDAADSLHTLLTTPISLIGDVQGGGLLTAPIPMAFKENPVLPGKASMTLPGGSQSQRPSSPQIGMLRYNTG
jgi:hypothetical protein